MEGDLDALNASLAESPFHQLLELKIVSLHPEANQLRIRMPAKPQLERAKESGQHHGGVIASLIDIAGDFALIWKLGHGVPTIDFRTDYLRPAINTDLFAVATIRKVGRSIAICDVDVFDENDRLISVGRGCYSTKVG